MLSVAAPGLVPVQTLLQNSLAYICDTRNTVWKGLYWHQKLNFAWICDLLDQLGSAVANKKQYITLRKQAVISHPFIFISFLLYVCFRKTEKYVPWSVISLVWRLFINRSPLFILLIKRTSLQLSSPASSLLHEIQNFLSAGMEIMVWIREIITLMRTEFQVFLFVLLLLILGSTQNLKSPYRACKTLAVMFSVQLTMSKKPFSIILV